MQKSCLRKILKHVNEVVWHEENGGTIWEPSHRCCIVRKVIRKEVTAGGRFDFFWTLEGPRKECLRINNIENIEIGIKASIGVHSA